MMDIGNWLTPHGLSPRPGPTYFPRGSLGGVALTFCSEGFGSGMDVVVTMASRQECACIWSAEGYSDLDSG